MSHFEAPYLSNCIISIVPICANKQWKRLQICRTAGEQVLLWLLLWQVWHQQLLQFSSAQEMPPRCGGVHVNSVYSTGFVGCHKDTGTRDLPSGFSSPNMTIDSCKSRSYSLNLMWSAVPSGRETHHIWRRLTHSLQSQCYCGESYEHYGPLPVSQCVTPCAGDQETLCGGD